MKNQPGPVGPQHQQLASTAPEVQEIDYTPEPELFDPAEVAAEIWTATHPE